MSVRDRFSHWRPWKWLGCGHTDRAVMRVQAAQNAQQAALLKRMAADKRRNVRRRRVSGEECAQPMRLRRSHGTVSCQARNRESSDSDEVSDSEEEEVR